ncbi:proton-conducting transporter transmembrane domain-containing protein [Sulfurospirillum sp. 1612]|uniref:proton-conducting transporter transmembrane domain-containing protein n=1 Tax=Sulfurospirillum sp. 1612 TaxID=3094835 RepID=UPI002F952BD7
MILLLYVFLPFILFILALLDYKKVLYFCSFLSMILLSTLALVFLTQERVIHLNITAGFEPLIYLLDIILLLYFAYVGWHNHHKKIITFAVIQLVFYLYAHAHLLATHTSVLVLDKLAALMLIIINLVGATIVIYAYRYIQYETTSPKKKNFFLSYLWIFIAIMNMLVLADDLLLFFFFFELTTLSSYLLIRFREDAISIQNALDALMINQIGGVFLLMGISMLLYYQLPIDFSAILKNPNPLQIAMVFLAFAAFVKGAMMPFERWLVGAMVAPTPVSAILHAATMVKIAPFLILKLAPSFSQSVAILISLYGAFVFFSSMLKALDKDNFKEILAYSTIAMLALMMSIAAIGTPYAETIVLYLIFFHALSKAILFMCAGILEKEYQIRSINDFENLISKAPLLAVMILIAFASLSLPPFGLFFAKIFSIAYLSELIHLNILYAFVLIFIVMGSSLMVLLYFKVTSLILVSKRAQQHQSKMHLGFLSGSLFLFVVMAFGIIMMTLPNPQTLLYIILATLTLIGFFMLLKRSPKIKMDPAHEYYCGEKDPQELGNFYFDFTRVSRLILIMCLLFLSALIVAGVS